MKRYIALLLVLAVCTLFSACSGAATTVDETTTLTGIVVNIEGSTISIIEMDSADADGGFGNRPSMPSDSDMREDFDPGKFDGERPERPDGEGAPQGGDGEAPERPDGEGMPQFNDGERPERPDGEEMPQGGGRPVSGSDMHGFGGKRPDFDGERPVSGSDMHGFGGMRPDFEGKTTDLDIGSAHITVEADGVKETGSLESIRRGSFVTVTINPKGEVTNVLVAEFGGQNEEN